MTAHTQGPWTTDTGGDVTRNDGTTILARVENGIGLDESFANAERAVACVNACQGISNEALHAVANTIYASSPLLLAAVTAQRDELAAALRRFMGLPTVRHATQSTDIGLANAADCGRAALAKVPG